MLRRFLNGRLESLSVRPAAIGFALVVLTLGAVLSCSPHYAGNCRVPDSATAVRIMRSSHMLSDWLFFQLTALGENGYDRQTMYGAGDLLCVPGYLPLARFSPPWYYLLFAPLGFLSPVLFYFVSVAGILLASVALVDRSFALAGTGRPPLASFMAGTLLFAPLIQNAAVGQVSAFLALGMVLALHSFKHERDYSAGFWLGLLSAKPQSTYLLVVLFVATAVRERRFQLIIGYTITVAALAFATYAASPSLYTFFTSTRYPIESKTLTVATYVRMAILAGQGIVPRWPIVAVSAAAALATFVWAFRGQRRSRAQIFILPGLSAVTAPYGWFYDLVVLAPANILILRAATNQWKKGRPLLLLSWTALNVSGLVAWALLDYLYLGYFPLLVTILAYWVLHEEQSASPQ